MDYKNALLGYFRRAIDDFVQSEQPTDLNTIYQLGQLGMAADILAKVLCLRLEKILTTKQLRPNIEKFIKLLNDFTQQVPNRLFFNNRYLQGTVCAYLQQQQQATALDADGRQQPQVTERVLHLLIGTLTREDEV